MTQRIKVFPKRQQDAELADAVQKLYNWLSEKHLEGAIQILYTKKRWESLARL